MTVLDDHINRALKLARSRPWPDEPKENQTLRRCPQSLQRQLNSSTEGFQK